MKLCILILVVTSAFLCSNEMLYVALTGKPNPENVFVVIAAGFPFIFGCQFFWFAATNKTGSF